MSDDTIPSAAPTEPIDTLITNLRGAAPEDVRLFARAVARHFEQDITEIGESVARLSDRMSAFVDSLTTSGGK